MLSDQYDRIKQLAKNITANQPVSFFNTVGVEVPKSEAETSPPKDAPKPKLLLS